MSVIVGLMALGLGLIALEIFIPGGIVGIFGGLSLLGAIGLSYRDFGAEGAILAFGIGLAGLVVCLYFEFKVLPKTAIGKRLFLVNKIDSISQPDVADATMIGKEGITVTAFSPTGYIVVGGKKMEAFSRDGFLEKGEAVKIVSYDQFKVTVSKLIK